MGVPTALNVSASSPEASSIKQGSSNHQLHHYPCPTRHHLSLPHPPHSNSLLVSVPLPHFAEQAVDRAFPP